MYVYIYTHKMGQPPSIGVCEIRKFESNSNVS